MPYSEESKEIERVESIASSDSFSTRLSQSGKELSPATFCRIFTRPAAGGVLARLAESKFYRADCFACWSYHKPISKVLPPNDDQLS